MIRITHIASGARFWDDDHTSDHASNDASAVIQWETPRSVTLSSFRVHSGGRPTRKMLRELVGELLKLGVQRIRTIREHGNLLPLAQPQKDGTYISDVAELAEFCSREERRALYPPGLAPKPIDPSMPQRRRGERDWQPTQPAGLSRREGDEPPAAVDVPIPPE